MCSCTFLAEERVEGRSEQGLDRPALGGAEHAQLAVDGLGKVAGDLDAVGTAVPGGPAGSGGFGFIACPRRVFLYKAFRSPGQSRLRARRARISSAGDLAERATAQGTLASGQRRAVESKAVMSDGAGAWPGRRRPRTVSARACLPAGLSERSCALPPPDCRVYPGFARLAIGVVGTTCSRCHDCCGLLACRALEPLLARGPGSDWDDLSATDAGTVASAARAIGQQSFRLPCHPAGRGTALCSPPRREPRGR